MQDSDVAELYGVETKRSNEAVSNNPDKFPEGYIIRLEKTEWDGWDCPKKSNTLDLFVSLLETEIKYPILTGDVLTFWTVSHLLHQF